MMPKYFTVCGHHPLLGKNIFDIIVKTLWAGNAHKESHWMSKLNDDGRHVTWFKQGYENINTTLTGNR